MTKTAFFANANGIFKKRYPRFVTFVGTQNPQPMTHLIGRARDPRTRTLKVRCWTPWTLKVNFLSFLWSLVIVNEFIFFMCLKMNECVRKGKQKLNVGIPNVDIAFKVRNFYTTRKPINVGQICLVPDGSRHNQISIVCLLLPYLVSYYLISPSFVCFLLPYYYPTLRDM